MGSLGNIISVPHEMRMGTSRALASRGGKNYGGAAEDAREGFLDQRLGEESERIETSVTAPPTRSHESREPSTT